MNEGGLPSARTRAGRLARWVDDRVGVARAGRSTLQKVFPNHWSFLLGEIALYSFVVLVITGVFLTFFFKASTEPVTYDGSYEPLQGVEVSQAYKSTLDLSFDVRAGLVMRQMHHWAALVFVAAIVVHLARVFFTGAFRRPRELNWVIGITLLLLGIVNGFAGYSLPDDQLSGTGVRIAYSVLLSVPFIGPWAASLLFGGGFPGEDIIPRLFAIHILIVPVIITGLLVLHLGLLVRHKHTHFPGKGARDDNVVGERLWPTYVFKAGGLFFLVGAVLAALGGLAQINPVWMWGPYQTQNVSSASQPDWYMGWLEGALRLMPNWEWRGWGYQIPNPFWAAVLLPGVTFTLLYLWPWIEARVTEDRRAHHVLDRPRDRPVRTALGAATLSFYTVLGFAGSNDVLAIAFDLSLNAVLVAFRVLLFTVPPVVGVATYRVCKELQRRDGPAAGESPGDRVAGPGQLGPGDQAAAEPVP
ncbi:cytochrome bc1 complex cytochrome b subunit [Rhabdothermincola sediminis]|uniref:cytochrome bc1 complex cytochrome b subunit n=1 Tax=Rhabdothermincola sediminis TaxID=2751370 RepID=UPI001AA08B36|nr:ubiquinol-cytochrome c reductase cytochrome b subunit [Rhabdothermincola sediminis]